MKTETDPTKHTRLSSPEPFPTSHTTPQDHEQGPSKSKVTASTREASVRGQGTKRGLGGRAPEKKGPLRGCEGGTPENKPKRSPRRTLWFLSLLVLTLLHFSCSTYLQFPAELEQPKELRATYIGTFFWEDTPETIQHVQVNTEQTYKTPSGILRAFGKGLYGKEPSITTIDIKIEVDPKTLRFEMWEANPIGGQGFITDGSHIGTISPDFRRIQATWTTISTGRKGRLRLTSPQ